MKPLTGPQAVALRKVEAAERMSKAPGVAPPSAYTELLKLGLIMSAERGAYRMTDAGRVALDADRPPVSIVDGDVTWYYTTKVGADRRTGERCAEYQELDGDGRPTGRRVWADFTGKIVERGA